jgi:hypothetical protein
MGIFALLATARKMVRIPFGNLILGSLIMTIAGILTFKGFPKSRH